MCECCRPFFPTQRHQNGCCCFSGERLISFLNITGDREGEYSWFPGASQLEFVSAEHGFDTTNTGLVCDEFRRSKIVILSRFVALSVSLTQKVSLFQNGWG